MAQSFFWPWPWSKRHLCKKEVNARGGRSVWKKFARNSSFSCVSHAAFSRLLVSLLHRLNADTVNTLSCCATKGTTSGHWKCRSIQIPTFSMERLFTVAPLWIVSGLIEFVALRLMRTSAEMLRNFAFREALIEFCSFLFFFFIFFILLYWFSRVLRSWIFSMERLFTVALSWLIKFGALRAFNVYIRGDVKKCLCFEKLLWLNFTFLF